MNVLVLQNQAVRSKAELRSRYFHARQSVLFHRRKFHEAAAVLVTLQFEANQSAKVLHHLWDEAREQYENYQAALLHFKHAQEDYRARGGKV